MAAPTNVLVERPVGISDWVDQERQWTELNRAAHGHPEFYPLTIKGGYVIGIIYSVCQSVSALLRLSMPLRLAAYLPAYGLFASGVELLGRCINGNADYRGNRDLETGFYWITASWKDIVNDTYRTQTPTVTTRSHRYTVEQLVYLRHFAAHGQATVNAVQRSIITRQIENVDQELLGLMPPLIANGLEHYWHQLHEDADLCHQLARANVIPLQNLPIEITWRLFNPPYRSVREIFSEFDWH